MSFDPKTWLLAARPKTLPAAIVPVIVGSCIAWSVKAEFSWLLGICTLLSTLCLQVATNYFNDAIDFKKGADSSSRLGPTRVAASGMTSSKSVYIAGIISLLVAALFSVPLIQARGWIIIAIGLLSLFFCYGYTGGPFPLAYLGLGEIFVTLFFGLIAVTGTAFVHCSEFLPSAVLAGLQIGLLSSTLLAINNLRDIDEDRRSGKKTLAVRFGKTFARYKISILFFLPYLLGQQWMTLSFSKACLFPLLAIPTAFYIANQIFKTEPSTQYNRFLGLSALHLLLFSTLLCCGLLFS